MSAGRSRPFPYHVSAMVLGLCIALTTAASASPPGPGDAAPDWTLEAPDGAPIRLQDLRGQAVVLVFWASWCPYCKRLFPGLQTLVDFHEGDPVRFLAVDIWDDAQAAARLLEDYGYAFELLIEGDEVAARYGVQGTPTTFVIDGEGRVTYRSSSSDPGDPALGEAIQKALAASGASGG